jgi:endonuclease/exonuclease/phosphatase family metal-dependent hydrolase
MIRIASFNVENFFARPTAFNTEVPEDTRQDVLDAYHEVNTLLANPEYSADDKLRIRDLLVTLDIYREKDNGAIRRVDTRYPLWAWLRKNRGTFDHEPRDATKDVEITAKGRASWIGWVELAKEPVKEPGTRMTARVIGDINADIIGIVEAEDRPSLVRFNKELLEEQYGHVMLVDGNDPRGIDVALMTRSGFEIESIRSNVDTEDDIGTVFSRDCPEYEVSTPAGTRVHVLVNHFKSQYGSGGGGEKRRRQAAEVRKIANRLVAQGKHVVVLGDLNEGPAPGSSQAANLSALYSDNSPLVDCYSLPEFVIGNRPGTFDACGPRNRLDYVLISQSLVPQFRGGVVFRKGLWGSRSTRPTNWDTYSEMTASIEQASDHAAVYVDLDI